MIMKWPRTPARCIHSTLANIIKQSTVTILPVIIFSLIFSLYGIVAKRLRWIYWLNSMNNVIPVERRSQIDWEGYSNVMGNIISISGFILVLGWIVIEKLRKVNYFPIVLLTPL